MPQHRKRYRVELWLSPSDHEGEPNRMPDVNVLQPANNPTRAVRAAVKGAARAAGHRVHVIEANAFLEPEWVRR